MVIGSENETNLKHNKKRRGKEMSFAYECVGTEEENQRKVDDIFDYIFEVAIKKMGKDFDIDKYRQEIIQ